MNPALARLYRAAPPAVQGMAASAWGRWLSWTRFGKDSEQRVAEALERDRWPADRLRAWREERLAEMLDHAARRVPYYRAQWDERRRRGDRAATDRLENWPTLPKEELRRDPSRFLADDARRPLLAERTSGTTGTPLTVWLDRSAVRGWFAAYEARIRRWNGVTRFDPWANLGGQLVVPRERARPPFWVWNSGMRQLYLSSYHLAPGRAASYAEALREHGVRSAIGYPSSLASLASFAAGEGVALPPLEVVVTNAEPLFPAQRERLASAFRAAVRETYGMSEGVAGASECAQGAMHLWPEPGIVEIFDDGHSAPAAAGSVGRVVATGLLNRAMPLIRYETGDRAALAGDAPCACGRALERLRAVEGRLDDVLVLRDGTRVGRLDPVFKADLPIREAQIVQVAADRLRVLVVPDGGTLPPAAAADLTAALRERVGRSVSIEIVPVAEIPRTAAGKLRAVVALPPGGER
jgi:phenylacetate-CoA ligase